MFSHEKHIKIYETHTLKRLLKQQGGKVPIQIRKINIELFMMNEMLPNRLA